MPPASARQPKAGSVRASMIPPPGPGPIGTAPRAIAQRSTAPSQGRTSGSSKAAPPRTGASAVTANTAAASASCRRSQEALERGFMTALLTT